MNFIGVKKTKYGGGGCEKKIEGGGMQERGKEDKIRGGGGFAKKI